MEVGGGGTVNLSPPSSPNPPVTFPVPHPPSHFPQRRPPRSAPPTGGLRLVTFDRVPLPPSPPTPHSSNNTLSALLGPPSVTGESLT